MSKLFDSYRRGYIGEAEFVNTAAETPYVFSESYRKVHASKQFTELDYANIYRMIAELNLPLSEVVDKILDYVEVCVDENEWLRHK